MSLNVSQIMVVGINNHLNAVSFPPRKNIASGNPVLANHGSPLNICGDDFYTQIFSTKNLITAGAATAAVVALLATRNATATRLAFVSAAALLAAGCSDGRSANNNPRTDDPSFIPDDPDDTNNTNDTGDTNNTNDTGEPPTTNPDADGDGFTVEQGDCDDNEPRANPDGLEVCNDGIDNDCNGLVEGEAGETCEYALDEEGIAILGDNDYTGFAVSGAGDVNNDGNDDVVVGAVLDDSVASNAGAAYVFFGPITDALDVDAADITLTGTAANEYAGSSVAPNNGGVAVGAPYANIGGGSLSGALYVVDAPSSGEISLDNATARYYGEGTFNGLLGNAVASAGDVDEDGIDDLIVGAIGYGSAGSNSQGAVYLISNPVEPGTHSIADAYAKFTGIISPNIGESTDRAGFFVAGGGDFDGNGIQDSFVGSPNNATNGYENEVVSGAVVGAGAATIILNPPWQTSGSLADVGLVLYGINAGDQAGSAGAIDGDLNLDGYDDVTIGAPREDSAGNFAGAVYVVFGGADAEVGSKGLEEADMTLWGERENMATGVGVAYANLNNDIYGDEETDILDLVVTAGGADTSINGAAYVLLGPFSSGSLSLSEADLILRGNGNFNNNAVANAGDTDGDGFNNLLIGAPQSATAFLLNGGNW